MGLESDARVIANALGFGGFGKKFHVSTLIFMGAKNTKKNQGNSGQSADAEDICGAGAKVYRVKFTMGNHSKEKVVKLVNKRKYFNNEKSALEQLSKGAVSGDDGSGPSRCYYKATQFFPADQFFLMPFARISLFHFLRDCHNDALPMGLYFFWMSQILDALTFAHSVGVMHGDVKLENIFLSLGGAILGDWGFAVCRITGPVRMLKVVRTLPENLSVISIRDSNITPIHESVKPLERAVTEKQAHIANAIIDTLNAEVPLYKVCPCGTLGMLHMLQVKAIYQQHFFENYPPLL